MSQEGLVKRPIDRVMEQFGSKSNKEVFRLLRQSINVIKGDLWSLNPVPGNPLKWPGMVQDEDPRKALTLIRDYRNFL
ncbi:unnamed protein product [Penicillium roqueforti FM164]|uniref:Uncharacterized protein n=1 Tax=Penicillium roqueforti (strain FM164) TaxID=1365484 RepID=W6R643_PENRF|nr:unnamed protein product [Penicillium roqueforti FM164]